MSTNSQPASGPIALIAAQIVEESIKPDVEEVLMITPPVPRSFMCRKIGRVTQ